MAYNYLNAFMGPDENSIDADADAMNNKIQKNFQAVNRDGTTGSIASANPIGSMARGGTSPSGASPGPIGKVARNGSNALYPHDMIGSLYAGDTPPVKTARNSISPQARDAAIRKYLSGYSYGYGRFPGLSYVRNYIPEEFNRGLKNGGVASALGLAARAMTGVPDAALYDVGNDIVNGGPGSFAKAFFTGDVGQPTSAAKPKAPTNAASTSAPRNAPNATINSPEAAPDNTFGVPVTGPGITVTREGNGTPSFSGKNVKFTGANNYSGDQGIISKLARGTLNSMPASKFANPSPTQNAILSAALDAAAARGDFDAVDNYYRENGGKFNGKTAEDVQLQNLENKILNTRGKTQSNLIRQYANLISGRINPQTTELNAAKIASANLDVQQKKQVQDITKKLLAETDPTKRRQLQNELLAIVGRQPAQPKVVLAKIQTGTDKYQQPIYQQVPFNTETQQYIYPTIKPQYTEGQHYVDKKGNRAVYRKGQFVPVL